MYIDDAYMYDWQDHRYWNQKVAFIELSTYSNVSYKQSANFAFASFTFVSRRVER